jgi:hypothetical protein
MSEQDAKAALKRLEEYRALRKQLEAMVPARDYAIRLAYVGGETKAEIMRASGLTRPPVDDITRGLRVGQDLPDPEAEVGFVR